jgi:hypothetical protein
MTPKEKAKEVLLSYSYILNDARIAKRCALIAVDEIIKAHIHNEGVRHLKWWEEVKQEINKL